MDNLLAKYGISHSVKKQFEQDHDGYDLARVIAVHKDRFQLVTDQGFIQAEITGHLRFTSENASALPTVGDWVAINRFEDFALIHHILRRYSVLERKATSRQADKQVIAANIDVGFITMALDQDFNLNRVDRYLTLCNNSRINSILLLNKSDLLLSEQVKETAALIREKYHDLTFIFISTVDHTGLAELRKAIENGKTYCFLGSSGVGKSTIINLLLERKILKTSRISSSTGKGKHTTSHRELFLLPSGGLIIDTPGMREVGIIEKKIGIDKTFESISLLAKACKYNDCTHTVEAGCAVSEALVQGNLEESTYKNYLTLQKEREHFEASYLEKKAKDKSRGKILKEVQNRRKKDKF